MPDPSPDFRFTATCVGSVPFSDIEGTCADILTCFPKIPFWPQFAKRSFLENMSAQFCEGLPLLEVNEKTRSIKLSKDKDPESVLTVFYEHFLSRDLDAFAMSKDYAPGFFSLLDLLNRSKETKGDFIKGQIVGPITFASGILDFEGKPLIHNAELLEAMVNGLAIKALWQVKQMEKTGRRPILFLDEPSLSGFGSAFSPIQRHEVIQLLQKVMNYLRAETQVLIGIHCCGNTDWGMLLAAGPDIINLDAFAYLDHFLLYPKEIVQFIQSGGTVAWGIVPTADFCGTESVEGLFSKLQNGLGRVNGWGVVLDLLAERSLLTPACGMGTMEPDFAKKGMELLARLSAKCQKKSE